MGTKRLDTISDAIRHDLDLMAKCECGRIETIDPQALMKELVKHKVGGRFAEAAARMYCKRCKRKGCKLTPVPRF